MHRPARVLILSLALAVCHIPASSQIVIQPTPLPTVTAENEPWYLAGDPIMYGGNLYYPGGVQIFFKPNEMVRSGFHMGIPLYTRTTIEPYSIVYVPLVGGRMQPYERPRTGELAGTTGSTPAILPTPRETVPPNGRAPQAPGPPTQTTTVIPLHVPAPIAATPAPREATQYSPNAVGTAGRAPSPRRPTHTRIGGRPQGSNSIFIELQNRRWYPAAPAEPIDTTRMVRIDDYKGFDVWADRDDSSVIYIPVTRGGSLAVRYTRIP